MTVFCIYTAFIHVVFVSTNMNSLNDTLHPCPMVRRIGDSVSENDALQQPVFHGQLNNGLNNMLIGLGKLLLLAEKCHAQVVMPCMPKDYINDREAIFALSVFFDGDFFKAQVEKEFGVEIIAGECVPNSDTKSVYRSTVIMTNDTMLQHLVKGNLSALPRRDDRFYFHDTFSLPLEGGVGISYKQRLFRCLRPAPRLAKYISEIDHEMRRQFPDKRHEYVDWCGIRNFTVVGLHLRTEGDMVKHCNKHKKLSLPLELCAPDSSTVLSTICDDFGLPCEELSVYIATGSPRQTFEAEFSSRFRSVYTKDVVLSNGAYDALGREELAIIDEFTLLSVDLFIGSAMSTLSSNVKHVRSPLPSLMYISGKNVSATDADDNTLFFRRAECS